MVLTVTGEPDPTNPLGFYAIGAILGSVNSAVGVAVGISVLWTIASIRNLVQNRIRCI